jgi:hypothetical protein
MKYLRRAFFLILVASAMPSETWACSCGWMSHEQLFDVADVVFTGVVIGRAEALPRRTVYSGGSVSTFSSGDMTRWTVVRHLAWKGTVPDTLNIYSARGEESCGFQFRVGDEYLIYSSTSASRYGDESWPEGTQFPAATTSRCSGTIPIADGQDLEFLGKPRPQD